MHPRSLPRWSLLLRVWPDRCGLRSDRWPGRARSVAAGQQRRLPTPDGEGDAARSLRVSSTSTRSSGWTNPATPRTSSTRIVIAFMSGSMTADRVPRCPAPVILAARIGSFLAIDASTVRGPPGPIRASRLVKAPAGNEATGHSTSPRTSAVSAVPNRKGRCGDDYGPRIATRIGWWWPHINRRRRKPLAWRVARNSGDGQICRDASAQACRQNAIQCADPHPHDVHPASTHSIQHLFLDLRRAPAQKQALGYAKPKLRPGTVARELRYSDCPAAANPIGDRHY